MKLLSQTVCAGRALRLLAAVVLFLALGSYSVAQESVWVEVTIDNFAPEQGFLLTPAWVAFHEGTFDTYDDGSPLPAFMEPLVEDGNTGPVSEAFAVASQGVDATISFNGGPVPPGQRMRMRFQLDPNDPDTRFFSYASMVIPSNDAFIANGTPDAIPIFDAAGNFLGADIVITGEPGQVNDAGTEVNDEIPANTAAFGQAAPNTGVDENGVVSAHPGLMLPGSGGVLDDPDFANAQFVGAGGVGRIRVVQLTEVTVTATNTAPRLGTFVTPVWVSVHNGIFDAYDAGSPADSLPIPGSDAIERIAEDGNFEPLADDFAELVNTAEVEGVDGVITSGGAVPPLAPEQVSSITLLVDATTASYFSYASMVIPSNDTFIANGDPQGHPVFDAVGNFVFEPFFVFSANDAGTEVNDETPANTAFFGQAAPDTGVDEGGVISQAQGFNPEGSGGILDDPRFARADYTVSGYSFVRFDVRVGPGPTFNNYFAQFADGAAITSSFTLFNNRQAPAEATILIRDDEGNPLAVEINGEPVEGPFMTTILPGAIRRFTSGGTSDPVAVGSVAVRSSQPLVGNLTFGGATLAGVASSPRFEDGFVIPVNTSGGGNTGVAVQDLDMQPNEISFNLYDADGNLLGQSDLPSPLAGGGHIARQVTELGFDAVDLSDFQGTLEVITSGPAAGVAIQIGADGELSSLPATPRNPDVP